MDPVSSRTCPDGQLPSSTRTRWPVSKVPGGEAWLSNSSCAHADNKTHEMKMAIDGDFISDMVAISVTYFEPRSLKSRRSGMWIASRPARGAAQPPPGSMGPQVGQRHENQRPGSLEPRPRPSLNPSDGPRPSTQPNPDRRLAKPVPRVGSPERKETICLVALRPSSCQNSRPIEQQSRRCAAMRGRGKASATLAVTAGRSGRAQRMRDAGGPRQGYLRHGPLVAWAVEPLVSCLRRPSVFAPGPLAMLFSGLLISFVHRQSKRTSWQDTRAASALADHAPALIRATDAQSRGS